jgi:hypothetical protein
LREGTRLARYQNLPELGRHKINELMRFDILGWKVATQQEATLNGRRVRGTEPIGEFSHQASREVVDDQSAWGKLIEPLGDETSHFVHARLRRQESQFQRWFGRRQSGRGVAK